MEVVHDALLELVSLSDVMPHHPARLVELRSVAKVGHSHGSVISGWSQEMIGGILRSKTAALMLLLA